jgi:predicted porin
MKKIVTILSTLLIASTSYAEDLGITAYGRLRTVVESKTVNGVATQSMLSDTSHIGFKATENLGNGLRANAVIETTIMSDAPSTTPNSFGDRISTVGLSYNNLGSVNMGRDDHVLFGTTKRFDYNLNRYGTLYTNIHNTRGSRISNAVMATVKPTDYLTFSYQNGLSEVVGQQNVYAYSAAAKLPFMNGQLVWAKFEDGAKSISSDFYGVKFEPIENTKVAYSHSINKDGSIIVSGKPTVATNIAGTVYGLEQTIGRFDLLASYGKSDTINRAYSVGTRYNFSKRTKAEFHVMNYDYVVNTKDTKQYGFVLEHNF